jgi:lipopolysaccharide assembly protein A
MDWKFVLVLIFSLFVAIFTMQNAEAVDIQFLTFEFTQVSQALVILLSAAAGASIALLFGAIRWVRDKAKIIATKKSMAGLETQVKQLRIMLDAEIAKRDSPNIVDIEAVSEIETSAILEEKEPVEELSDEQPKPDVPAPKKKWYQI